MGMSFALALAFGLLGGLAGAVITSGQIPPGYRDALAVLGALLGAILGAVIGGTEAIVHALSNRPPPEPSAPRREGRRPPGEKPRRGRPPPRRQPGRRPPPPGHPPPL